MPPAPPFDWSTSPEPTHRDRQALARWRRRVLDAGSPPWLHQEVARRMMDKLAVIRAVPSHLIDWGGADGAAAAALQARYPSARRTVVEPLLDKPEAGASRPAPWWRRWLGSAAPPWLHPDEIGSARPAQLVWSNLHLHWCDDPADEFARWKAALETDGIVMFSCYGPDTLRELAELYARHNWGPPAPPFMDMHDLGDALVRAGFADPVMDMERLTLHWADADAALSELRTLGSNAAAGRHAGCRTPRWRTELAGALNATPGQDGERLSLTFEIIYGHAFKPMPRPLVEGETRVSEADLRTMLRQVKPGPR